MSYTLVTVHPEGEDPTVITVKEGDHLLVVNEPAYLDSEVTYRTGTTVLTLKVRPDEANL